VGSKSRPRMTAGLDHHGCVMSRRDIAAWRTLLTSARRRSQVWWTAAMHGRLPLAAMTARGGSRRVRWSPPKVLPSAEAVALTFGVAG